MPILVSSVQHNACCSCCFSISYTNQSIYLLVSFFYFFIGTFLFNCHQDRRKAQLETRTHSLWTFIKYNYSAFVNQEYIPINAVLEIKTSPEDVKLWTEYY